MRHVTLNKTGVEKMGWALALTLVLSSCSLKSNGESYNVRIPLPGGQYSFMKPLTSWLNLAWASATTPATLDTAPDALADFDCFGVNVTGPGIDPDRDVSCTDPADSPSILGGFVPAGNSSVDLVVPSGPSRTIKIFGVRSLAGCPRFQDMLRGGAIKFDGNIGHFYEIGAATKDIFNDDSVEIRVSYNSGSPNRMFNGCKKTGEVAGVHLWGVFAGTGPGSVNATKVLGTTAYVGGNFDYVGPNTLHGVMLSETNGAVMRSSAHISGGKINCAAPDGTGGFYVGGYFNHVESSVVSNVAHIRADASFDSSFNVGTNGVIYACAFDGTYLYLGGSFSTVTAGPGAPRGRSGLAAIKVSDLSLQTFTSALGPSATVNALAYDPAGNRLYVGGLFSTPQINAIAYYTAGSSTSPPLSQVTGWNPAPNCEVTAIAVGNDGVFLGGQFTTVNPSATARSYLAQVNSTSGDALSFNASPNLTGQVRSIALDGTNVYAAAAETLDRVYRINFSTGTSVSILNAGSTPESFNALSLSSDGARLYVGGHFRDATSKRLNLLAIPSPGLSTTVSASFIADSNMGDSVLTIVPNGLGTMFVGGSFQSIGGVERQKLAALDLSSGEATSWDPNASNIGPVMAFETDGTYLYAGYDSVAFFWMAGVLKLPAAGAGTEVWRQITNTYSDHVYALALNGTKLYVGGQFSFFASGARTSIAKLEVTTGTLDPWNPSLTPGGSAVVKAIAVKDGPVFAAGTLAGISGGPTSTGLVAIDPSTGGTATGWTNNPGLTGGATSLAFGPLGRLIVGSGNTVQRFSPVTGASIPFTLAPPAGSYMSTVNSLAVSGTLLYVGGTSLGAGFDSAFTFDIASETLVSSFAPRTASGTVSSIEFAGPGLVILGGNFNQVNTDPIGTGGKMSWGLGAFNAGTGLLY